MKFIVLTVCLIAHPIFGKTFSLMHPAYNTTQESEGLTLNGIVFVSDKEWVIWINHKRITPNKIPDWLKIIKVTDNCVQCDYLHQKLWYQVTLEPYDTFTPSIKTSEKSTEIAEQHD
jgi:hypothetical protein